MSNEGLNITPGRIFALWRLIVTVHEYKGVNVDELYRAVLNTSAMGGGLPLQSGIKIAIDYGFLTAKNKQFYLSPFSSECLIPICNDIEPSIPVLRKIFHEIIKKKSVPWIIYFNLDVEMFKLSIPNTWLELLESAKLLHFNDKEVQDWWHSLIESKSVMDEAKKKGIGEIGEKLTFEFEKVRIKNDGIPNVERKIIWVANISDEYGFDILSLAGKALIKRKESDNIYIEVKASELSNPKIFTFYISENEWNKAIEYDDDYYFFCWPGIKLNEGTSRYDKPFVVPGKSIAILLPHNNSVNSQWVKCRVSIDLSDYSIEV